MATGVTSDMFGAMTPAELAARVAAQLGLVSNRATAGAEPATFCSSESRLPQDADGLAALLVGAAR